VAKCDVVVTRYADDLVVGFENRMEARRFLEAFRQRLAKFGLELHAEKTRLIELGGSPLKTGSSLVKESRKRSRSWALPTSVGSAETALSSSGESRRRSGW